jgi:hypothetical protein
MFFYLFTIKRYVKLFAEFEKIVLVNIPILTVALPKWMDFVQSEYNGAIISQPFYGECFIVIKSRKNYCLKS